MLVKAGRNLQIYILWRLMELLKYKEIPENSMFSGKFALF